MARGTVADSNFLQPIFSAFGLIASIVSAVAPFFAQSQLQNFFVTPELSLASSIISVILGILLSWYFVSMNAYIDIPVGIKKDRGKGFNEPWKRITERGLVLLVLLVCLVCFATFFLLRMTDSYIYGVAQALVYIVFFVGLIGAFALLFISSKRTHDWQQQAANTGSIVFETLERNGTVKSGIEILHNTTVSQQELMNVGLGGEFGAVRLIVKTVPQDSATFEVYLSPDYSRLLAALPMNPNKNDAQTEKMPPKKA